MSKQLVAKIDGVKLLLAKIISDYTPATFASSYGAEDMVLMDFIYKFAPEIAIFTLDTGRIPKETHALIEEANLHYKQQVTVYFPNSKDVNRYVTEKGLNAFYDSVALRKTCCKIRKVKPLKIALKGKKAWLTGMRRAQAISRKEIAILEWDDDNSLHKFSPLVAWSNRDIWTYIKTFNVPYNLLHDKDYASIGCQPCTRAITVGEDMRAGRWWWENAASKECGLHVKLK